MIHKTLKTTAVLSVFLLAGCDGVLDINPTQSIGSATATSSSANLESVLIGAYNGMSNTNIYGGDLYFFAELLGNSDTAPEITFTGTFSAPQEAAVQTMQVSNGQAAGSWNTAYFAINQANTVIANADVFDAAIRDAKVGEALFIRGSILFELVKAYALPYSAGSTSSNPGVPVMITPDNFDLVSRASIEEVYTQVIADLQAARDALPGTNGTFATSHAANAQLSRVYLQMGNYAGALAAANAVIGSGAFSLEPTIDAAFNNSSVNSSEDIFATQISTQDGVTSLNTFFASSDFGGRGDVSVNAVHTALYEAGDARGAFFYNDIDGDLTSALRTTKWQNTFGNVPVMRLAEMYLTRAEANSELSSSTGATPLADVNAIRARAGLAALGAVTLPLIRAERKLELAFEGQLLHDLRRTQSAIGSFAYDAGELVFPIPQGERDVNPNLTQNAAYTN